MAGKDVAAKATAAQPKSVARWLRRVARAVLYMLRHGGVLPSGWKLSMDLSILLRRRGKNTGKAAPGGLVNFHHRHHHHGHHHHELLRGRHEVEFSCSNTPSQAATKLCCRNRHHRDDEAAGYYSTCDAADIARVFEMLNDDSGHHLFDDDALAVATPSPALWRSPSALGRSPAARDEQQQVDRKADEFIRRFYEHLREQQSVAATPDYHGYGSSSYNRHSPRPVAAGIA